MNVFPVLEIANPVIGKSSLPDFFRPPKLRPKTVRVSPFDQLYRPFQRDVGSGREQQVHMLRHEHEGVELKRSVTFIAI